MRTPVNSRPLQYSLAILASLLLSSISHAETPTSLSPADTRQAFLKIIDRPKVPADYTETALATDEPIQRVNFTYASDATHKVPGIMYHPRDTSKKHPVVMALHGTGGSKDSEVSMLKTLAGKGFIAVAIDGRYHGERGTSADYNAAIAKAFAGSGEHPLYFDTVWDIMRLMDVLQARPDVDGHFGMIGTSKGGIETWITSAMDERVTVSIPCIGVQSFKYGLGTNDWKARVGTVKRSFTAAAASAGVTTPDAAFAQCFYDKLIPGIYDQFDGPQLLPIIAPRALLVINGDHDDKNPLPGLKLCTDAATAAYEKAGVPEKFKFIIQKDVGHNVTSDSKKEAVAWFVKYLNP